MKRVLPVILSIVMVITALPLTSVISFAEDGGDFVYSILDDGTAEITEYNGSATEITIPSEIDGYTVTSIGIGAFIGTEIESVTVSENIRSIGYGAFAACPYLKDINIDANNAYYCFEDGVLFNKNKTELVQYLVGNTQVEYTVPSSVTSVYDYAFFYCTALESIKIPNSVIYIGSYAFGNCASLTSLTIPDSLNSIGEGVFSSCELLESVIIPNSVKSIDDSAFSDCISLTSITIPDSVTSICNWAFSGCTSLSSVSIGNGVTSIGDSVFDNCTLLTDIVIPNSVTKIGNSVFFECTALSRVTISENLKIIDNYTFYGCTSLENIIIPDSVTSVGEGAFWNCSSLTSVTIPDSVTSIGSYAFNYCSSLTCVAIPGSVTSIGIYAFNNCPLLQSVFGCKGTYAENWVNKNLSSVDFKYVGDLNEDGEISIEDYMVVKSAIAGQNVLTKEEQMAADYNTDGAVDGFDMFYINKTINGYA